MAMKITNTFVPVAADIRVSQGIMPPLREGPPTVGRLHYDLLSEHPYEYDIDSLNFEVWCRRNRIADDQRDAHRDAFFSKGHPCMRASPLTKTYGFGAHYNGAGKIAIYPMDSVAYRKLLNDPDLKVEPAMRSKRLESTQDAGRNPRPRQKDLQTVA